MSSKSVDLRNMVCPPTFNDENAPINSKVADMENRADAKTSFPTDKGAFASMMKLANMKKADHKSSGKGAFGRLLADVTNDQKEEQVNQDEKHALDIQCDEALHMASQWMQMDADEKLAMKTEKALVDEERRGRLAEIQRGESAAMTVAIEERKNLVALAQSKKEQEKSDVEYAKNTIMDDVEEQHRFRELCKKDDEVAKKVYAQLQDELMAEELQAKEDSAFKEMQAAQRVADKARIEADFEVARKAQIALDVKYSEEKFTREKKDAAMALNMAIKTSREEHRRFKKLQLVHKPIIFNTIEKVGKQWEEAEADVEDVSGGLCLTILLPYLRDIKIKAMQKNCVDLEAYRIVGQEERHKGLDNEENSQYCAEFVIEGNNVNIISNDLSFEYSSDTGLLHVYVENVHLDGESTDNNTSSGKGDSVQSNSEAKSCSNKGSAGADVKGTSDRLSNARNVVGTITSGFKRLFSRK